MSGIFIECSALASLDLSGLDTSNVTNMKQMFYDCSALASLDLSGLDTSGVTNMDDIFIGCQNLQTIYVKDMVSMNKFESEKPSSYNIDFIIKE